MPTVLITAKVDPDHISPLDGVADVINGPDSGLTMSRDEVLRHGPQLDAIITQGYQKIDTEMLNAAPSLKIVANMAAGYNNLVIDDMTARGVWATNTPDAFVESTADCTIGLLLALVRRIAEGDRYVRAMRWSKDGLNPAGWDGMLLRGRTLGIIGYGKIGKAVATRARAFGMKVIHHNRTPGDDSEYRSLDDLLAESDVVSINLPLNSDSENLINADRLKRMKPRSILVNIGRGKCADEQAIVDALRSGQLAGAALDVFDDEPNVHPDLLTMDNVVLTPHIGGSSHDSRRDTRMLAAENVALVLQGKRPTTPLNEIELVT